MKGIGQNERPQLWNDNFKNSSCTKKLTPKDSVSAASKYRQNCAKRT